MARGGDVAEESATSSSATSSSARWHFTLVQPSPAHVAAVCVERGGMTGQHGGGTRGIFFSSPICMYVIGSANLFVCDYNLFDKMIFALFVFFPCFSFDFFEFWGLFLKLFFLCINICGK